jgi:beta-RFAP synthase
MLARALLPAGWRVLVALPDSGPGLHGRREAEAFRDLPPFPRPLVDRLCGLVLLGVLPAVAEDDLAAFGGALEEIQGRVGDAFASAQGGRYASPAVEAVAVAFREAGLLGVGQSSWGPAVYGFAREDSANEARLLEHLEKHPALRGAGCLFWTKPSSSGAALAWASDHVTGH